MTEERFLSISSQLGYRYVQRTLMGAIGFACSDGSVDWVHGWWKCVEDCDKCSGFFDCF